MQMNSKPRPGIFAWYVQLPLGIICAAIYWHARIYDARREPVAMGLAYGALVAVAYDLFLRWKLRKHKPAQPNASNVRPEQTKK